MTYPTENHLTALMNDARQQGDEKCAERILDLLNMVVTSAELINAIRRSDKTAIDFHSDLLTRQVNTFGPLKFRIVERPG